MRLAGELQITGHTALTKPEIITAIARVDGVQLDTLTRSELLPWAAAAAHKCARP